MGEFISREAAIIAANRADDRMVSLSDAKKMSAAVVAEIEQLPAADVVPVQPIIDRINKERLRAKGNWHTDPYWLGWVDAMKRAQRVVDGTVDDEPVYATSNGADMRDEHNEP